LHQHHRSFLIITLTEIASFGYVTHYSDDYRGHTSCITEVERYEKRPPKKNGKVPPQQLWMDLIKSSIESAPTHLKSHIHTMSMLDNVPRKEKPFYNFTSNSLNLRGKNGEATVSQIWTHLKDIRTQQATVKQPHQKIEGSNTNVRNTDTVSHETSETSAQSEGGLAQSDTAVSTKNDCEVTLVPAADSGGEKKSTIDRKVIRKKMTHALKRAKSHSLSVKLLRKSVLEHFKDSERNLIKDLVRQNLDCGKRFVRDGKIVTLKSK
jgi:LYAR-type C2HC zinc finger